MNKVAPVEPAADNSTTYDEPLLTYESSLGAMMGEGITTVTFFTGDLATATAFLRERLAIVSAANPWILGRIVKEKQHGKKAALRFSTSPPPVTEDVFVVNETLKLSEDMLYEDMVKLVNGSGAKIPQGRKLLNKPLSVSKTTVLPTAEGGFAVIFSMSHTIANGSTYYQILNMLSTDGKVFPMNTVRRDDLHERVTEYMGKSHYAWLNGAGAIFNGLGKALCGKDPTAHCFLVDDEKLAAAKAEARAQPGAPARISANDVLTARYGKACGSRVLIMAADFKGRIEGTTVEDAGQYHAGLLLDEDGYAEPATIRNALTGPTPLSRCAIPPGCCASLGVQVGLITSWAAFKNLAIPACTLTLHTPCEQTSGIVVKAQEDTCIVFNPRPGKIAMLCISKHLSSAELLAALPFEGPLSPKMWPVK